MKKIVYLTFIVMFAVILGACAKATLQPGDGMINPGDKIGDFLITTGDSEGRFLWEIDCVEQSAEKETCKSTVGNKVNVSWGIYDDTGSGKLDTIWSEHTYEMVIEGRPVNLQAFGSIESTPPYIGQMRHWNVVIVTDKAGEITIQHSVVVKGESYKSTTTLIFSAP